MTDTAAPTSHGWNHPQCYPCWFTEWGLSREPMRVKYDNPLQHCCFCGRPTISGINRHVTPGSPTIAHCTDIPTTLRAAPAHASSPPPTDPAAA